MVLVSLPGVENINSHRCKIGSIAGNQDHIVPQRRDGIKTVHKRYRPARFQKSTMSLAPEQRGIRVEGKDVSLDRILQRSKSQEQIISPGTIVKPFDTALNLP